jgi:hypothetical protein
MSRTPTRSSIFCSIDYVDYSTQSNLLLKYYNGFYKLIFFEEEVRYLFEVILTVHRR